MSKYSSIPSCSNIAEKPTIKKNSFSGRKPTAAEATGPASSIHHSVISDLNDGHILGALMKLPQNVREIVVLRDFQNLNKNALSKIFDRPINSMGEMLSKARTMFRGELLDALNCKENQGGK